MISFRSVAALIAFVMFFSIIQDTQAQQRAYGNFGAGVMIGHPTGLTGKMWLSDYNAFHGAIAWEFSAHRAARFHLHFDYARYNYEAIQAQVGTLAFYYGIGGRLLTGSTASDRLGIRFPFGLNYEFDDHPIEIFVEVVPLLDLTPGTDVRINSGAGLRYYFGSE